MAVAAYRELVRGNTTHRTAETGSLRPASTAKQAAQSRQGGDEGGFAPSFRGFAGVGAPRDARDVRIAPHYRSRSRLSISGGSGCADSFPVGVPFTLQWPPMAVWAHQATMSRSGDGLTNMILSITYDAARRGPMLGEAV